MKREGKQHALFRPFDLLILLPAVGLSLLFLLLPLLLGKGDVLAVVTKNGTNYYPLGEERTITLSENGYSLTVAVEDGAVFVREANCPEQICRRTGRIARPGETILCSCAGVLLRIEGEGMFDAVAG